MKPRIFPSIIASNQQELDLLLRKLQGVSKTIHLDIVDGKFAPNHSLDFEFKLSDKFSYHAHVMAREPEIWIRKNLHHVKVWIPQFLEVKDKIGYIHWMKKMKRTVAFALAPKIPVELIHPFLRDVNLVLILTVRPGFYGSKYRPEELQKVAELKKLQPKLKIMVDGHMTPDTIKEAKKAGADYFISGSFISQSAHPQQAMKELQREIS